MPIKDKPKYSPFNWDPSKYGAYRREDITEDIKNGSNYLYKKDYEKYDQYLQRFANSKFIKTPTGYFIVDSTYVPRFNEIEVDLSNIRKLLPKRAYIGGGKELVRKRVFDSIPGFRDSLLAVSNRYHIDPNLVYERLQHEGFLDQTAQEYNNDVSTNQQKDFFKNISSRAVNGFNSFGLDDSGRKMLEGKLTTIRPLQEWFDIDVINEKGEPKVSVELNNLYDALEVKGAELRNIQNQMIQKGYQGEDLNTWTNAAYNLGANHEDLRDSTYIRKNYNVPDWGFQRNKLTPLDQFRIDIKK